MSVRQRRRVSEANKTTDTLLLDGSVEDYDYLNKSRREVDGIDDREEWALLKVISFIVL